MTGWRLRGDWFLREGRRLGCWGPAARHRHRASGYESLGGQSADSAEVRRVGMPPPQQRHQQATRVSRLARSPRCAQSGELEHGAGCQGGGPQEGTAAAGPRAVWREPGSLADEGRSGVQSPQANMVSCSHLNRSKVTTPSRSVSRALKKRNMVSSRTRQHTKLSKSTARSGSE